MYVNLSTHNKPNSKIKLFFFVTNRINFVFVVKSKANERTDREILLYLPFATEKKKNCVCVAKNSCLFFSPRGCLLCFFLFSSIVVLLFFAQCVRVVEQAKNARNIDCIG